MNNIFVDSPVHMDAQSGLRELYALAAAGIKDGAAGLAPASEAPEYGACYASAALLAAAERGELMVSAGVLQDEAGVVVGYWVLHGPGAADDPAEPMEMAELRQMTARGLRLYNPYGQDLTETIYTLH